MTEDLPILDCSGCGACCFTQCSPPFEADELNELPRGVRRAFEQGMIRRDETGYPDEVPCFWLDTTTRRCQHYDHRPAICREFEIDSPECHEWRDEFKQAIRG